ncbi:Gfo/Idh/MocA family protein, partial [Streptomyces sp. NPDC057757]|uniref:Gfo/Idh/MocA family protein n=1 Tax=Streptomyces sp. NPDC057757 TaxID=3346241 RepID=UPI0036A50EA8
MRVGVIGAGLQCGRRISALAADDELVGIAAPELDGTWTRAHSVRARVFDHWDQLLAQPGLDAVIVATPPDSHLAATVAALTAGKHVLCEKPLARGSEEAALMEAAARDHGRVLHCGFNHRFHPAVRALARIVADAAYGRPLSALGVY